MSGEDMCVGIRFNQIADGNGECPGKLVPLDIDIVKMDHEIITLDNVEHGDGEDIGNLLQ